MRQAAHLLFIDELGRVLLVKRAKDNFYGLPGGLCNDGEKLEECLCREVYEEIKVPTSITSKAQYVGFVTDNDLRAHLFKLDLPSLRKLVDYVSIAPEEIKQVCFAPVDKLASFNLHPTLKKQLVELLGFEL